MEVRNTDLKSIISKMLGTQLGNFLEKKFFGKQKFVLSEPYDVLGNTSKEFKKLQMLKYIKFKIRKPDSIYLNLAIELTRMRGLNKEIGRFNEYSRISSFISPMLSKKVFEEIGLSGDDFEL